eukprot:gene41568-50728_t
MGFFGEIIDHDGIEIPIPEGYHLRIIQACVNPTPSFIKQSKTGSSPLALTVTTGDDETKYTICVVNPATGHYQAQVGHTFGPEDGPVVFQVTGGELHVTGEWLWEDGEEEEEDDEEGEEEVSEEASANEEPPSLVPLDDESSGKEKSGNGKKRSKDDLGDSQPADKKAKVENPKSSKSKGNSDGMSEGNANDVPKQLKKWKIHPESDEGVVVSDVKSVVKTGGVVVTDYIMGKGHEPKPGATVKVLYEGYFPDGTLFDAKQKKKQAFVFRKGTGQVIKGMDVGLEGMRVGGAREVFIPYAM